MIPSAGNRSLSGLLIRTRRRPARTNVLRGCHRETYTTVPTAGAVHGTICPIHAGDARPRHRSSTCRSAARRCGPARRGSATAASTTFRVPEAVELPPELGDDPRIALRRTLGMFATGVTVITTREGDQVHGMTANAFMSVSLEPPLVLISVDRRTKMCALLHEGRNYGVSVLCEARPTCRTASPAVPADEAPEPRFEIVHDTPLVDGALAHFVANVTRSYWGGDHSLFLGRVEYARYSEGTPPCCSTAGATSGLDAADRPPGAPHASSPGPRPLLLRVVEREPHDRRRDPLLVAVELADLDLGAGLGVLHGHAAQRDVLAQRRAARAGRDHADLRAPAGLVHAVAVAGGLVALELEPDERPLRVRLALDQRRLADEVVLGVERHREADARPRTGRPGRRTRSRRRSAPTRSAACRARRARAASARAARRPPRSRPRPPGRRTGGTRPRSRARRCSRCARRRSGCRRSRRSARSGSGTTCSSSSSGCVSAASR